MDPPVHRSVVRDDIFMIEKKAVELERHIARAALIRAFRGPVLVPALPLRMPHYTAVSAHSRRRPLDKGVEFRPTLSDL
eukprot:9252726-Pyramimonas_sp.AAC.1